MSISPKRLIDLLSHIKHFPINMENYTSLTGITLMSHSGEDKGEIGERY